METHRGVAVELCDWLPGPVTDLQTLNTVVLDNSKLADLPKVIAWVGSTQGHRTCVV